MATEAASEYTVKQLAEHSTKDDLWMAIHGQVYDVTKYINDHPGGADILIDEAGKDATEAFDNAGHSEDAFEIMKEYQVGKFKGTTRAPPKAVQLVAQPITTLRSGSSGSKGTYKAANAAILALAAATVPFATRLAGKDLTGALSPRIMSMLHQLPFLSPLLEHTQPHHAGSSAGGGFAGGALAATVAIALVAVVASKKLAETVMSHKGFEKYPPHMKVPKRSKPDPLLQRGWLEPSTYHALPLAVKDLIAPNVYRLVFTLPTPEAVLGLPIGQHVAIKATVDGQNVSRSYTPVSNNADKGVLELVIKCYPDGLLTGRYLANLVVGEEVLFRGPKGAMRYRPGLCKKMGMLAGGTGITPVYQLIRAICENEEDTTEVSLIYANRTEEDILLRPQLESFARRYPKNFKLYYVLDKPPADWAYGRGYVTMEMMAERFPQAGPDSKIMICGPPGMVNAAKKSLVSLGFEKPGAMSKMGDQIFCF